jgi:hypothetical protein
MHIPKSGCFRKELTKLLFELPERLTIDDVICLLRRNEVSPELPAKINMVFMCNEKCYKQ